MKRSEMLKILQTAVVYHMNPTGPAETDEEMYSNILSDLERAGMLPPTSDKELEGLPSYYKYEWESEQ